MNVKVLKNYEELSRETAEFIVQLIHNKPKAVICLASGNSPLGVFEFLIDEVNNKRVDLTQVTFIGLDDFVGMGKEDDGSGANMLYHHFYIPAGIKDTQIHLFNTKTENLDAECKRIDNIIFDNGGLDMILLGIGMNGHLGFNEPGVSFDLYSHVIELDETTKTVGQKYFKQQTPIDKGITLGIKHILEAKVAVVIADGVKKADVVQKMIEGPVTNEYPCTIISAHPNAYVIVDEAAYEKIK